MSLEANFIRRSSLEKKRKVDRNIYRIDSSNFLGKDAGGIKTYGKLKLELIDSCLWLQ